MSRVPWMPAVAASVVLMSSAATRVAAQTEVECARDTRPPVQEQVLLKETAHNTLVFDHYRLSATRKGPHVLSVKDGGYLQVRFICTDPTKFNYTITANTDAEQKIGRQGVNGERVETRDLSRPASVTMRHSKLFTRYRVEISLRDDLKSAAPRVGIPGGETGGGREPGRPGRGKAPDGTFTLYSTFFDLWVETAPEWTVDFSGGVAFTGLRNREYFIKTDTKDTPDTADDVKTVEEDVEARASFRPDIIALANVRHPRMKGLGATFGVGLNNDADPRYFLGASYLLGGKFIFSAGWAGGKVNELPVGQELHKAPINGDNTLTTLAGRFRHAFYFGVGFTFINREPQFAAAFAAAQTTADEEPPAGDTKELEVPQLEAAPEDLVGSYTNEKDTVVVDKKGEALTIKLPGQAAAEPLTHDGGLKYHVGTDPARRVTFLANTAKKVESVQYQSGTTAATYKKKPAA